MKNLNVVKFFLVAAALIGGMSSAMAEDLNLSKIAVPGTSVNDSATSKPLAINCHDCDIANTSGIPLNGLFEPRGAAATGGTQPANADD